MRYEERSTAPPPETSIQYKESYINSSSVSESNQRSPSAGDVGAVDEIVTLDPPSATLFIHADEAELQTIASPSTRSIISTFERLSSVWLWESNAYPAPAWFPHPCASFQFDISEKVIPAASDALNTGSVSVVKYVFVSISQYPGPVVFKNPVDALESNAICVKSSSNGW